MQQQTLVGIFRTRAEAENVRNRLRTEAIPDSDISISGEIAGSYEGAAPPRREESFWDWLFGSDVSDDYLGRYYGELRDGRAAVSVRVRSEAEHDRVATLMDQFDPIDVEEKGDAAIAAPAGTTGVSGVSAAGATARGPEQARGEQVIPVAKEELDVGKRQTERRYRVRTHIVERPVEEQVHLRDERVTIERRPASRAAGDSDLRDRDVEIVERHEEPVVAKKAGAAEEVVVRKEASDRVETVRDKVRETKVDIDRAAAGEKPGIGTGADPVRTPKIPD